MRDQAIYDWREVEQRDRRELYQELRTEFGESPSLGCGAVLFLAAMSVVVGFFIAAWIFAPTKTAGASLPTVQVNDRPAAVTPEDRASHLSELYDSIKEMDRSLTSDPFDRQEAQQRCEAWLKGYNEEAAALDAKLLAKYRLPAKLDGSHLEADCQDTVAF